MPRSLITAARSAIAAPRQRVRDARCSLWFDLIDDRGVGSHGLGTGDKVFTLEGWFRFSKAPANWGAGIAIGPAAAGSPWLGGSSTGTYAAGRYGIANHPTTTKVSVGEWVHLALTHEALGGPLRIYLNGTLLYTSGDVAVDVPSAVCSFGAMNTGVLPFGGNLSGPRIWSSGLIASQLLAVVREGPSAVGTPHRWWKLEDGVGATAREEIGGTDDAITGALWSPLVPFRRNRIVENVPACPYRAEVAVSHHADLSLGAGSFGIGGWIVAPPEGTALNLAFKYSASAYMFLDVPTTGLTRMRLYDGTTLITCASPFGAKPLTWMHLFGVRDNVSGLAILYVDGVPMKAQALGALGDIGNTANLTFINPAAVLFGANDLLWRKGAPFTWDEIRAHYFDGIIPANPGGGVVQIGWAMREGAGTTVASSPAGYNGTLSAASWTTATRCKARIAVP